MDAKSIVEQAEALVALCAYTAVMNQIFGSLQPSEYAIAQLREINLITDAIFRITANLNSIATPPANVTKH